MFSTPEFVKFTKDVVPFLHNTSRVDGEPYPNLLFEKGGNGYPTVSFLDADGRPLHQLPLGLVKTKGVQQLRVGLRALEEWRKLRAKLGDGDSKELFLQELGLGMLEFADAQARFRKLGGFEQEHAEAIEQQLVNLEFSGILRKLTEHNGAELGAAFVAMIDKDRIPNNRLVTSFWQFAFAHAEAKQDPDLFAKVLARAKKAMAGDSRLDRYVGRLERQLEELREKVATKKAKKDGDG